MGSIPASGRPPWRRKWQPTPVFLNGKPHGQRSLAGYSPRKRVRHNPHKRVMLQLSRFSRVRLGATHRRQPTRLRRPWNSPGKNTGVGCHFLLQCMKVKSESEVAQSCPTLSDPMDCSPPGSSIHGIFQARVLEWGAIAFSDYTILHCSKL